LAASEAFRDLLDKRVDELDGSSEKGKVCASSETFKKAIREACSRAEHYSTLRGPAVLAHYGLQPPDPSGSREAYFVALVSDMPPRWIEDVTTGRW
jgi:hypothetical protein